MVADQTGPRHLHIGVVAPWLAAAPKTHRPEAAFRFGTATCRCRLAKYLQRAKARCSRRHQPTQDTSMGLFSKDIETMDDLFLHTLQDIYYAENKIVKSLPEMIETASDAQLKQGLEAHLGETKGHVKRLEQVFQMLGQKPKSVNCPAIDGIIEEAEEVTGEVDDKNVLDAAIIAAGQAVEHYEITRYGSLIAWAKQLGRNDAARLLEQTLGEEKAADKKLTGIAERKVNLKAAG
jgi:ferritin-like metal-binding protein YciE